MQVPHTVYNGLRWKTAFSRVWRPSSDSSLSFIVNTISEGKSKEPDQTADAHTAINNISICKDTQEWPGMWLGGAVSCILRHWGVQLILAYSWAKPAILVAGTGRGECFYLFCFFTLVPVPLSSQFLFHLHCRPRWLSWMRRPTGDQEVAGSTPVKVGNILSWRLIMKHFLQSLSPFCWFKKGSCQFLGSHVHNTG